MKRLLLALVLALGLATSAYAEKVYTKEEAETMCAAAINGFLDDLTVLAAKGLTPDQLKAGIQTKDPEIKALLFKFIDEVVAGKTAEAGATLLKTHTICSQRLQEVEA